MITYAKKLFTAALIFLTAFVPTSVYGQNVSPGAHKILRVIDGDTIEISGGDRIRLLGIDAPEKGESFYDEAAKRLRELTGGGAVTFEFCDERDVYGRLLATIRVNTSNINSILLQEGMALPLLIPPCGYKVAEDVLKAAAYGVRLRMGIYSKNEHRIISHLEAGDHLGEHVMVIGEVMDLHKGREAWHLNFGPDWKTDFTAVLLTEGQNRYLKLGIDPEELIGIEVMVIGKIRQHYGAQIIVRGPDQIIPLK